MTVVLLDVSVRPSTQSRQPTLSEVLLLLTGRCGLCEQIKTRLQEIAVSDKLLGLIGVAEVSLRLWPPSICCNSYYPGSLKQSADWG